MTECVEISWDEFEAQFGPKKNHLDDNASLDGVMFETFGGELDYVLEIAKENPERVWTYAEGDEDVFLTNGLHFVNRLGYVVTERPATSNTFFTVVDEL
jgi:hypothetical protein